MSAVSSECNRCGRSVEPSGVGRNRRKSRIMVRYRCTCGGRWIRAVRRDVYEAVTR